MGGRSVEASLKKKGMGVKPMSTKASVIQPNVVRTRPKGILSSAVGGCLGPISSRSTIIKIHMGLP